MPEKVEGWWFLEDFDDNTVLWANEQFKQELGRSRKARNWGSVECRRLRQALYPPPKSEGVCGLMAETVKIGSTVCAIIWNDGEGQGRVLTEVKRVLSVTSNGLVIESRTLAVDGLLSRSAPTEHRELVMMRKRQ